MSANRSVQAAQRRRAGNTAEPGIPGRGPQTSINSAQMFANQSKTGHGPNIPNGRLAGQHVAMQQNAMQQNAMQQKSYQESSQKNDKLSSVNKMTIPQAITLITLRLGALETKLLNNVDENCNTTSDTNIEIMQSIISRIETLESGSSYNNNSDVNALKKQFENTSQSIQQVKKSTNNLIAEQLLLKTQLDTLKKEIIETKELLQNFIEDNSKKIFDQSTNNEATNNEATNNEATNNEATNNEATDDESNNLNNDENADIQTCLNDPAIRACLVDKN